MPSSLCHHRTGAFKFALMTSLIAANAVAAEPRVQIGRVPEGGLQPSAQAGEAGRIHLVYLTGEPKAADIHYVTRTAANTPWSAPRVVNSQPGSAVAIGTVRGPRLAPGAGNSVHVVWNGSSQALPKPGESSPLLYSRLSAGQTAFEPQRALGGATRHLDGGAALAANAGNQVAVVWHAALPEPSAGGDDETKRAVFVAASDDGGSHFAAPRRIDGAGAGVCACCGLEAGFSDPKTFHVLYRGAEDGSERGMRLLTSTDAGQAFAGRLLDRWSLTTCPMTTLHFAANPGAALVVWSTRGEIKIAKLPGNAEPMSISGPDRRANHPVSATNTRGETLVAWTEGTGWQKGGALAYVVLGADLKPVAPVTRQNGVPVWGSVTAWAETDGSFTVLF